MTTIIVTHEDNEIDEFEFDAAQRVITIGRRSSNDVCIPDLSVSGNHAKITLQDGQAWLEDLNSTNGSYVNGQVIFRQSVGNDDDVMMGKIRLSILSDAVQSAAASVDAARQQQTDQSQAAGSFAADTQQPSSSGVDAGSVEKAASPAQSESGFFANETPDNQPFEQAESQSDGQIDRIAPSGTRGYSNADASHANVNGFSSNGRTSRSSDSGSVPSDSAHSPSVIRGTSDPLDSLDGHRDANGQESQHPLEGIEHLVAPPGKPAVTPMHELDSPGNQSNGAVIEIKNGAKSGQILPIDKPVTTLGRPGIQIAAIMRKPDGYFLMHIESDDSVDRPTLNRDAIGDEPVLLHSGDELNVAGIDVEFMLS